MAVGAVYYVVQATANDGDLLDLDNIELSQSSVVMLLWNHPAAKKHLLMPGRHSDLLFCLQGIPSIGTCPPIGMDSETFRRLETVRKC